MHKKHDDQKLIYNKKNFIFIAASILVIMLTVYFINDIKKYRILDNKKRLIEVSISRENFFWDCFNRTVKGEEKKWENSEEYLAQKLIYNACTQTCQEVVIDNDLSETYDFGVNFSLVGRLARESANCSSECSDFYLDNPWQQYNEVASKFCSESADNTQEGILVKKLRKKVPVEMLTDYELKQIVAEKN